MAEANPTNGAILCEYLTARYTGKTNDNRIKCKIQDRPNDRRESRVFCTVGRLV